MFFAPKEIKKETGESLVYNPHRTMVSKEFTFDAAHHLFNYEGKCKSLHGHTYSRSRWAVPSAATRPCLSACAFLSSRDQTKNGSSFARNCKFDF